jgi:hypothetical protein
MEAHLLYMQSNSTNSIHSYKDDDILYLGLAAVDLHSQTLHSTTHLLLLSAPPIA